MIADEVWKHTFDQAKEWPHGAVGHQVEQVLQENHDPTKGVGLPLIVVFDHLDFALEVSDFLKGLLRWEILKHSEISRSLGFKEETVFG